MPHRREQAIDRGKGEMAIDNPNSAVVWHYGQRDRNGDGKFEFDEEFHRSISSVVVKERRAAGRRFLRPGALPARQDAAACIGPATCWPRPGVRRWLSATASISPTKMATSPCCGCIPTLASLRSGSNPKTHRILAVGSRSKKSPCPARIYSTPVFAGGVLYIAAKDRLFAIPVRRLDRVGAVTLPAGEQLVLHGVDRVGVDDGQPLAGAGQTAQLQRAD